MIDSFRQAISCHSGGSSLPIIFMALVLVYLCFNRYGRGLNSIPGPFLASITSFWKTYVIWKKEWPWLDVALHEKYGPLVRIGPSHISAASLEAMQTVHISKKGFQKTKMYNILQPYWQGKPLHNVFSLQNQIEHTALKRSLGSLYNTSSVIHYEPNLDRSLTTFVQRLNEISAGGMHPVDLAAWLQYWALDASGEVNFSQSMGFLEAGKDVNGICKLDSHIMFYFAVWGQIPAVEKIYSRLSTWNKVEEPNPVFEFVLDVVQRRLDKPDERLDMLNSMLRLYRENPNKFGLWEVHAATYINVITGQEVLAITLRAVVYYLCRNCDSYKKLMQEIREADRTGRLSTPAQYTEVSDLPYLSAVIEEALRIHPSTGTIFERYVPRGGTVIHDKFIPESTIIGMNAWVMNRNKSIFGADVETFRPERWLESSPEQLSMMRKGMATFGAGSRYCIGKNLAMVQMTKALVEMYRNFDFRLAHPEKEWRVSGAWLTSQSDMDVIITPLKK